jgi:phage tail sheath protein FI
MALFAPSESPAIVVKEVDLTGGVPNVQSTTGAFAGEFLWGPVGEAALVSSEAELAKLFGAPTAATAIDFTTAAYFLKYANSLYISRVGLGNNATGNGTTRSVKNKAALENGTFTDNDVAARYPGALGNGLEVHICTGPTGFAGWAYANSFDAAPATSAFATARGNSGDESHLVVVDGDGKITGTVGQVLEAFPFVSFLTDAKNDDGSTNFIKDVVNNTSSYIYVLDDAGALFADSFVASSTQTTFATDTATSVTLTSGTDVTPSTSDYQNGFDLFNDKDTISVDFLIASGNLASADLDTLVDDLVVIAKDRKDCIVVTSPPKDTVVNNATAVADTITFANGLTYSSYLVVDNNYLKVYDKYNDQYIWIPAASSTAGLMAASDLATAPWFSPAGARRGQLLGITSLAYTPTKSERDQLYRVGVNPIANLPGQGALLYGDKTHMSRPSAFDRINVRRLFIVVERAIALAARNTMFEFNDEFTRAEFVNIVEPFLREVKGRRGITDFRVVCDDTNNTAEVVDRNEFIANIFIKPARSINYITLNFVAVRSGVDFEEVAGIQV